MTGKRYAAIVLSAGKGTRMGGAMPKQYMELGGRPILSYSLQAFEESAAEEIVLVAGEGDIPYCQKEIVEKYGFRKVRRIIPGGKERYHSVYCGLSDLKRRGSPPDYVMIHDGARPFLDAPIIRRCEEAVETYQACVAGMPVKDTIKIADGNLFVKETPERGRVWQVQTPQAFSFPLIYGAYHELIEREGRGEAVAATDDAMALEAVGGQAARLVEGSYRNIKITTPEDLEIALAILGDRKEL